MPPKLESPIPKNFPCRIGVDYWLRYSKTKKRNLPIYYKYSDAIYDCEGWADPMQWLPDPFDLCWLKTLAKTIKGWWSGAVWDGLRLKKNDEVKSWKKCTEDMHG